MQDLKERMKSKLDNLKQKNKNSVIEKEDSMRRLERSRSPRTNPPSTNRANLEVDEETTWDEFSFGTQVDPTERDNMYNSVTSYDSRSLRSDRRRELLKKKEDMELRMQELSRRYRSEAALDVKKDDGNVYNSTAEFRKITDSENSGKKMSDFQGSFRERSPKEIRKHLPRSQSEPEELDKAGRVHSYDKTEVVFEEEFEDSDFENTNIERPLPIESTRSVTELNGAHSSGRMQCKYNTERNFNLPPLRKRDDSNETKNFKKKKSSKVLREKSSNSRERSKSRSRSIRNKKASYNSVQNLRNLISENRSRASLIQSDKENSSSLVNRKSEIMKEETPYSRDLLLLSRKLEETDKQSLISFKKLSEKYEKLINEYVPYTEDEDLLLGEEFSEELGDIASKCIKKKKSN